MALPIRRATPQPRPNPTLSRRVVPAPLASPQAKPTLATRGHTWIPRPRITASRRVVPAPLASPQAKPTLAARGHIWLPRPPITASRRVVPALFVAVVIPPATVASRGVPRRLQRPSITPSHSIRPAPPASPQAKSTNALQGVRRIHPKRPPISRLLVARFVAAAPVEALGQGGELGHIVSDTGRRYRFPVPPLDDSPEPLPMVDNRDAIEALFAAGAMTKDEFLALSAALRN